MRRWLQSFTMAFVLTLASCATTDFVTGKEVQNMYMLDEDIELGSSVLQESIVEMEKEGCRLNVNPKRVAQVEDMVKKITAVSHLPDLPYEVVIFETNIVNAAAAPGGKMMVFSGLYDGEDRLVENEDELAAVLGHEIAHVNCRHTTEQLTREAPLDMLLLIGALYAEAKDKEGLATGIEAAFLLVHGLWMPKYSREDEAEADAVGMMYMAKAGYDPRAAPRIWKRLYDKEGDEGWLNIISSHPTSKARYKALENLLPEAMEEYAKVKGGYPEGYTPPAQVMAR